MTGAVECRYYGRDFTADEMALLRALIAGPPALNRHALSRESHRFPATAVSPAAPGISVAEGGVRAMSSTWRR